jgi:RHS repeat-associated protein
VNTTAPAGALQKTYSYEPFGQIRTESGTSPTNFFHFTGEYRDPTGLYHLRARQYDPTIGRFLRPDPLAPALESPFVASSVYVSNRPGVLLDPSGEIPLTLQKGQTAARSERPCG